MTDHKFTDEEVIKALEICASCDGCEECPYSCFAHEHKCIQLNTKDALDLINRQKAEIERMEQRIMMLNEICNSYALQYGTAIDKEIVLKGARAEAIKEFAERLKERAYTSTDWSRGEHPQVVECDDIDDLVEEMTEGQQ